MHGVPLSASVKVACKSNGMTAQSATIAMAKCKILNWRNEAPAIRGAFERAGVVFESDGKFVSLFRLMVKPND